MCFVCAFLLLLLRCEGDLSCKGELFSDLKGAMFRRLLPCMASRQGKKQLLFLFIRCWSRPLPNVKS